MVSAGQPRLPHVVQSLVIPAGSEPTGVEMVAQDWVDLPGTYLVAPAQPDARLPVRRRDLPPRDLSAGPDGLWLDQILYPDVAIRQLTPGTMSGYEIANVEVNPVRYVPATGKLQLATKLVYKLSYAANRTVAMVATRKEQDHFGELVRHLVVNPEQVSAFAPGIGKASAVTTLPTGQFDWVCVTVAPMDTVFARLGHWKAARGLTDTVIKLNWILANYTGYDSSGEDSELHQGRAYQPGARCTCCSAARATRRAEARTSFRPGLPTTGSEDAEPCDHYYECLDGTWDGNGNHTYGEIADNPDMYADISEGRAPVTTWRRPRASCTRRLTYEQNPSDRIHQEVDPADRHPVEQLRGAADAGVHLPG